MSSTLNFPDSDTMIQHLSNHPLLKINCYQKKGITKAMSELAAARFANSEKTEDDVKRQSML